jgi:hypothetical protein
MIPILRLGADIDIEAKEGKGSAGSILTEDALIDISVKKRGEGNEIVKAEYDWKEAPTASVLLFSAFEGALADKQTAVEIKEGQASIPARGGRLTVTVTDQNGIVTTGGAWFRVKQEKIPAEESVPGLIGVREIAINLNVGNVALLSPSFISVFSRLDAPVTWATSDEAVAVVDSTGLITSVAPGQAIIVATFGNGQILQVHVTVA